MTEEFTQVLGIVGMSNKGEYSADAYYEKLNVVTYQGSSYSAKDDVHGIIPTNTDYWQLLASKGDKGDTGEKGDPGNDGHTPVKGTDYYTSEDKQELITELEGTLDTDVTSEVTEQLSNLTSATPTAVSSISDMTDETKIYVLTTDGHWYWNNGTTWVDGGIYQASNLEPSSIDSYYLKNIKYQNLSDSAKKGTSGHDVKEQIDLKFEQGLRHNDGSLEESSITVVSKNKFKFQLGSEIILNDTDFRTFIFYIENGTRISVKTWASKSYIIGVDGSAIGKECYVEIRKNDLTNITPSEATGVLTITQPIQSVTNDYLSLSTDVQKLINTNTSFKPNGLYTYGNTLVNRSGFVDYDVSGSDLGQSSDLIRFYMRNPIYLPKGTRIQTSSTYRFVLVVASTKDLSNKSYIPSGGYSQECEVKDNDVYYLSCKKADNSNVFNSINDFIENTTITIPSLNPDEVNSIYVSESGDDSTGTGSSASPFKTIAKALTLEPTTLYIEPGEYECTAKTIDWDMKIQGLYDVYDSTTNPKYKKPILIGGKILEPELDNDTNLLKTNYDSVSTDTIYKVFVSQTLPIQTSTTRPSYYVTLWLSDKNDETNDIKLLPVLSLELCQNTANSFYYDGTSIYINDSTNISNKRYVLSIEDISLNVLNISKSSINVNNIAFRYGYGRNVIVRNSSDVIFNNCDFGNSASQDGVSLDYSNVYLYECNAYQNRNDGFNIHGFGSSYFYNCNGYYNEDDGISHHDGTTGYIEGGEWNNNGKGGVSSPTYGSKVTITGCYIHDNNTYGILSSSNSTYGKSAIYATNNLITNNPYGISATYSDGCIVNNKYYNNTHNKQFAEDANINDYD